MKVYDGCYKNEEGDVLHNVDIKGESFQNIPNIAKCKACNADNCNYYHGCIYDGKGVVRTFDCKKNEIIAKRFYDFVTSTLVVFSAFTFYKTLSLGPFKGTAALIVFIVNFDIFCCIVEHCTEKIRENLFYKKLKKAQKRSEELEAQKRTAEEAKKALEEEEANKRNPNRIKILQAEEKINSLRTLSDDVDFGVCDEKIEFCVQKLYEITERLKEDSSGYKRVAFLLEAYLDEFYDILKYYSEFQMAGALDDKKIETLTKCVSSFYKFLGNQKIEAFLDKRSAEIQYNATAQTLIKMINDGEELL